MKTHAKRIADRYLDLIRTFPLRPIRTEAEYDEAGELYKKLVFQDRPFKDGEKDYMEALLLLIADYDRKQPPLNLGPSDPISLLKHVMEERRMNVNDLGKVLGSQPTASLILNRKRQLSKANIRKLAAHFQLSPSLFL